MPAKNADAVTEGGLPARQAKGVKVVREGDGVVVFEVGSGSYRFGAPQ